MPACTRPDRRGSGFTSAGSGDCKGVACRRRSSPQPSSCCRRYRAFALFKGACGRGIYDNMKTAVETIFVGKQRLYNRRFLQMCSHYLVDPVACTPASGWEKGQVENQVGLVRERFFTPRLRFKNLDELNAWLLDQCIAYAKAHRHPELTDQTIWQVFEAERPKLVPYAGRFDGFHAVSASVSKTCLVRFDNNKYSVAASAVGRQR